MNREHYLEYIDHFNNKRYDAVTSYFAPDITVEYFDDGFSTQSPARTLHGSKEFEENYKNLHAHTREYLELGDFISQDDLVFAELYTEFHTFMDAQEASGRPWKKGDIIIMTNWVMYNLDDKGKMKRIRIAHFRNHDPETARYKE
jgi:hypothetical protein